MTAIVWPVRPRLVKPVTPDCALEVRVSETVSVRAPAFAAEIVTLPELPAARSVGLDRPTLALVLAPETCRSSW